MQPFVIDLMFETPLVSGITPPLLDAILLGEMMAWNAQATVGDLPLNVVDGVPAASQLFVDATGSGTPISKLSASQRERATLPFDLVPLKAGTIRNWSNSKMNAYTARTVGAGMFVGTGDLAAVRELLLDAFSLGIRRREGFGAILDWAISPVEEDPSTWGFSDRDGSAVRPVPISLWERLGMADPEVVTVTKPRPLYWSAATPQEACAVPLTADIREIAL